jgi:hypothetical protein
MTERDMSNVAPRISTGALVVELVAQRIDAIRQQQPEGGKATGQRHDETSGEYRVVHQLLHGLELSGGQVRIGAAQCRAHARRDARERECASMTRSTMR